ncbi:F-box domain [Arabidopsis suecica]|uniref:F-box domain n=1 Tax=Arabidopsis suecica TaxID=45249 RepID=A0A8T2HPM8_ARASU|nr:F-box domain [Arabidopsis suecica]
MNGGRGKRPNSAEEEGTMAEPSVKKSKLTESDWISGLADDLLLQILSKVPTRESVFTSRMSKRWRNLWRHVPALDLDSSKFPHESDLEDFFDSFLQFDGNLKIERFKWIYNVEEHCDPEFVSRIDHVVKRGLKDLTILSKVNIEDDSVRMPVSLYSCATLVNLTLYSVVFDAPRAQLVSLPCLKTMHLEAVKFDGETILGTLISSCSFLDELTIITHDHDELGDVSVRSPSLRRFKLESMREDYDECEDPNVEVDTPGLEYMSITDYQSESFIIHNISPCAKVNIDVVFDAEDEDSVIHDFITAISTVRELTISARTLEMIHDYVESETELVPQFSNLFCLHASFSESSWEMFPTFLGCCPNLHSLFLEFDCLPEKEEIKLSLVPHCFESSLEYVQLKVPITVSETSSKMELAIYFVRNCSVLKKLMLNESFGNVINKVRKIPKRSEGCKIAMPKPLHENVSHGSSLLPLICGFISKILDQ